MMQSMLTLNQVSQGVECLVKDHYQKQQQNKIMEICMKQGCTQPNILCPLCKNLHNDHRENLISIAEIEEEFRNSYQDNQNKLLLFIKEFEQFARKQLEVMVKKMKMLINPFDILEKLIMKNTQQSYSSLKDQVSELVKLIEFDNYKVKFKQHSQQEINIQIDNLANQYLSEITNFMQQHEILSQPIQKSSTQWNNILIIQKQQEQQQNNVLNGVQVPKIKDYYFLQENCGQFIECAPPNSVIALDNHIDYIMVDYYPRDYIACLNRNLEQSEGASLVFKINSINVKIGIGICQFEKASCQFFFFFDIGSGMYLASSNGFIYNSDYEDYNCKQIENFKMEQGQKYQFTFDPANKENKQFALEQANKIIMPMKIDNAYHYRIFVYSEGLGSEIELINE